MGGNPRRGTIRLPFRCHDHERAFRFQPPLNQQRAPVDAHSDAPQRF